MIMFIVNPNSGAKKDAVLFASLIKTHFPEGKVVFTERAGHASELAAQAASEGYAKVVACGGDGTINEVARALKGTNSALGVIPRGSGNGFAREIGMSLNNEDALEQLKTARPVLCDMGSINGEYFVNLAGIGIEAEIARAFARHGKRGMLPYFWIGAKTVFTYKPPKIRIITDGVEQEATPLTLVFANGRQYGSNFKIAPKAALSDGKLEMVQVQNKNIFKLLFALPSFFNSRFRPFDPTVSQKVTKASVSTGRSVAYHVDGEPKTCEADIINVEVLPGVLNVLMNRAKN